MDARQIDHETQVHDDAGQWMPDASRPEVASSVKAKNAPETRDEQHLFLVHSEITWLVAGAVIEDCGLEPQRSRLALLRGFDPGRTPPSGVHTQAVDWGPAPKTLPKRRGFFESRRLLAEFDASVEALVEGRRFHLYTPQTHLRFVSALRSHRLCNGFSLIEEGSGSYRKPEEVDRMLPVKRVKRMDRVRYRGRIEDASFFDMDYALAFATSELAFPEFPRRRVLKDVFAGGAEAPPEGCSHVLAFSSSASYGYWRFDDELAALRPTFAHLHEHGVLRVHYKCHPAQRDSGESARIEAELSDIAGPVEVVRLDDRVSLEGMAHADPTLVFITGLSSAGLYASLLGCSVVSYARLIAEREASVRDYIAQQPGLFLDRVSFLESLDEMGRLRLVPPGAAT